MAGSGFGASTFFGGDEMREGVAELGRREDGLDFLFRLPRAPQGDQAEHSILLNPGIGSSRASSGEARRGGQGVLISGRCIQVPDTLE